MNLYSIPPFIASILLFSIGFFVYVKDRKSKTHVTLFLLTTTTFIWLLGYATMFSLKSEISAYLCAKILFSGIIFIPIFFHHFVICYFKIKNNSLLIKISYVSGIFFEMLLWGTNNFIEGVHKYFWGYYTKAGWLHNFYLAFFVLCFIRCLYLLLAGYKKALTIAASEANRTKYLLWAFAVATVASLDFIAVYGIEVYPIGYVFMVGWVIITAYAIVRHQLMQIEVIIKKTLVFAGLFATSFAILVLPTLFIQEFIVAQMGIKGRIIGLSISAVLIILILKPLESFLVRITDRFLFQKNYNYKELLKTFTGEVLTVLDLNRLTRLTVYKLSDIIRISSCGILLFDEEKGGYKLTASYGVKNRDVFLNKENTLATFIERTHSYLSISEHEKDAIIPEKIKQDMNKLNVELAIPLVLHDRMIGILTLGKKKSDETYSQDDIDILLPLARTLSIAISNAELFDELSKTQAEAAQREKMAVIGTLSAGINHEICNPLGIVRGQCEVFMLNLKDGLYKNKTKEELLDKATDIMKKAIKEVDRATAVTKRLSGFAKPIKEMKLDEVNINEEIDEVMALVGHELKLEKVDVVREIPKDVPNVRADRKQIQEIFFNLIRNAGQAIGENGKITVRAQESGKDKIVIEIEDTGHGIPENKLETIFNPFYTTKEPGKGTGLGLFIVRQIIEKNKGKVSVKSKVGVGTTFTLEFPAAVKVEA